MKIESIHPDLRAVYRKAPTIPFHSKFVVWLINLVFRFGSRRKKLDGVQIQNVKAGEVGLRVYRPTDASADAALLWIHGGGLLIGAPHMDDRICADYCRALNLLVVSVDYRLASKSPYPAALDDCHTAWQWLITYAQKVNIDVSRVAIAGLSAGGGLAAALSHKINDMGGPRPMAQLLWCPMLDNLTAENKQLDNINHKAWNNKNNRAGWQAYLQSTEKENHAGDFYAVPARRENLDGLPPAWITVGDIDLFYAEDKHYSERLQSAGINCEFLELPMVPHGFESLAPKSTITREAFKSSCDFLQKYLA